MSRSLGSKVYVLLIALTLVVGACSSDSSAGPAAAPSQLVDIADEPAGANCEGGGVAIARGTDADGDGELSADEVSSTHFVCDAVEDTSGTGTTVEAMEVPVGDDVCSAGGTAIVSNTDQDGDGMVDASEVAVFCNAEVIGTEVLASGDEQCPTGGIAVHRGADENRNGLLDASEQTSTEYLCNGGGVDGAMICLPPSRWDGTEGRCTTTADWSGSDLAGAELGSTYLAGVDLSGADLSGASLAFSDLHGASLVGADLSGADLSHADVRGADFTDAVLDGANLAGVDLRDATLERTTASDLVECPERLPDGWSCVELGEQGKTLLGPGSSLSGLDLSAVDLSDADLSGVQVIDLAGCPAELPFGYGCLDLPQTGKTLVGPGADLSELDLSGADFSSVMNLSEVNFTGSDLSGAMFAAGTNLHDTQWSGADLSGVNLSGTNMEGATGTELEACPASLPGSFMCLDLEHTGNTLLGPGTDLSGLDLSGASLANVNLSNADLQGTSLAGADLTNADFGDADLEGADLAGATLNGADLSDARLNGTDLSNAVLNGADLEGANLQGATLTGVQAANLDNCPDERPQPWTCKDGTLLGPGADLSGLDLSGLDFSGNNTHLEGADLSGSDLSDTQLADAHLAGADLSSADLVNADLESADLSDAVLDGADLTDANLNDADISDASFTGATFSGTTCPNGQNSDGNGNTCL